MARKSKKDPFLPPDKIPLTKMQAARLSGLTGVEARELVGRTTVELSERLQWQIDPEFFFFRRICGRVVKRDPVTGELYPVPFADVHVMDTDCSLLGFFPVEWPWGWFFPLFCHTEEIASVRTDACGNFCVYIPRWEIDWILRWRLERICFSDIFIRPSIRDILERFPFPFPDPPIFRPPRPEPDPPPYLLFDGGLSLRRLQDTLDPRLVGKLAAFQATQTLGASTAGLREVLDSPAFSQPLPPPLPDAMKMRLAGKERKEMLREFGPLASFVESFDPERFIGPFLRCRDVLVPEWLPILDVPDITFWVTQDVDGDGDEETIYSEGFFDVRWNSGPIPDITLEASQIALSSISCDNPPVGCEEPQIVLAGKMPLHNLPGPADPYHDQTDGYARRVNRPHPSGNLVDPAPNPLASSPFAGTFPILGCNEHEGADYYRLLYSFKSPNSSSYTSPVPFTGHSWWLYRWTGVLESMLVSPDSNGWYEIIDPTENWMPGDILLNWPSGGYQNGTYKIYMELGNASKTVVHTTSPEIALRIDNSSPDNSQFTALAWRVAGTSTWTNLSMICPVVARPTGFDIEFRVSYQGTAAHLRSLVLSGGGCGGGNPVLTSALSTAQHWHTGPLDNTVSNMAVFSLAAGMPQGAYSFHLTVHSRAFNPDNANGLTYDWEIDPVDIWIHRMLPVAVVNT
ncbi:MAG TPA: hypothetical protein VJ768_05000 [Anaerolineales bacterium]|nr:hypothetical protein [Anaerolineales bacterium]